MVSPLQRCHGGEVVNACWREGDVPSLDMAACLGCSGLRDYTEWSEKLLRLMNDNRVQLFARGVAELEVEDAFIASYP